MVWTPSWNKKTDDKDDKDKKEELPPELEARFKKLQEDTTKTITDSLNERLKGLDSLTAFADEEKKRREKEAEEERKRKEKKVDPEDAKAQFTEKFVNDPLGAIQEAMKPSNDAILLTRADNVKREVFVDRANDFPYYDGAVKKEIDEILNNQTLAFRNNPQSVENVYHTVVGKHMGEIQEGKIKSRFASQQNVTTSKTDQDDKKDGPYKATDPDVIRAAKLTGMKPEDYAKFANEDQEVAI